LAAASPTPTSTPTIHADFGISASAGPGGKISPSGDQFAYPGSSFIYTITPYSGYQISNVIVDGISQGPISTYKFDNVQSSHEILAVFAPETTPTLPEIIIIAIAVIAACFSAIFIVRKQLKTRQA
jgi:hypothetical protein